MDHHLLHQHHQAADGLVNLFTKANHDLSIVQFKLEKEFQQTYPDSVNPMKLVSRIKKIQEDITTLKEQCREVLMAKQEVIDKARAVLVGNRNLLQKMQVSMGIPSVNDFDDPAFSHFKQVMDEWTIQVQSTIGDDGEDADANDINKLLFSAIVQNN